VERSNIMKRLERHGDDLALVTDQPILDLLKIDEKTKLRVEVNGTSLVVTPVGDSDRNAKFEEASADTFKKYDKTLRRLAE
jgi:hypothetical protein